jgi:hypothetical protein
MTIVIRPRLTILLTSVLLLTGVNLLVDAWSHRLFYYKKLEAIRLAQNPNLLFLGNSLLDHGVDELALLQAARDGSLKPLDGALGGTRPPEHRLLFEYAVRTHPGIRTLVVGIYDFQITESDRTEIADLNGNRMVGVERRFPLSEVASDYGFGPLDQLELEALRWLPLVANRDNAWQYVDRMRGLRCVMQLRQSMESMGMLPASTNSVGSAYGLPALESANLSEFDTNARAFIEHPDHFNTSYESIFNQAHGAGMKVVIVVMPMSPYHRATFYVRPLWRSYVSLLADLAARRNIRFIDGSDWAPLPEDFGDHVHMNSQGIHNFSIHMGDELFKIAKQ